MKDKRILYVSSEVVPYLPENEVSQASFDTPKMINDLGGQIRIFMPRYGSINERRHQLHEVIRLSGMNLVINDMDMPLIIKVASIPKERIQVYFIDNDDYFKRKGTFGDDATNLYDDNDERAIFFVKGVVETIKKLNWVPDVIHVHGWMASLLPLYMKKYYNNESIFADTKVITSIFSNGFNGTLSDKMFNKVAFDEFDETDINTLKEATFDNIMRNAIDHSDGIVISSDQISQDLTNYIQSSNKPFLPFDAKEKMKDFYPEFYLHKV